MHARFSMLLALITACWSSNAADEPMQSRTPAQSAPATPPQPHVHVEPTEPPTGRSAPSPDPISRFIERERLTGGMAMNNGIDPPRVRAPSGATIDAVLALVYDRHRYTRLYDRPVTRYHVLDRRPLPDANGGPSAATILLVDTNLGERLLVLRPDADGWYNREFAIVD